MFLLKFILTNICGHFECFFGKNYLYCAWLGASHFLFFFDQGRENAFTIQFHIKILFSAFDNIGGVEWILSGKEYIYS